MPLKVDVRTFKIKQERLPVSGSDGHSRQLLFAVLLLAGAFFLRTSRLLRDEEGGR
jgi:MYXO-CTERM domain-containing protein